MSTRSPYNDRNKIEQKGKTRKSAAASKPKREAGVAASSAPSKKKPTKKSMWRRRPASGPVAPQVQSPEMKKLRRLWWILWGSSLGVALIAVFIGQLAKTNPSNPALGIVYTVLLGVWAASFAGVIYLELGPIRKARRAALEAAKLPKGKKEKAAKADAAKAAVSGSKYAAKAAAPDSEDAANATDDAAGKDEDA